MLSKTEQHYLVVSSTIVPQKFLPVANLQYIARLEAWSFMLETRLLHKTILWNKTFVKVVHDYMFFK